MKMFALQQSMCTMAVAAPRPWQGSKAAPNFCGDLCAEGAPYPIHSQPVRRLLGRGKAKQFFKGPV